MLYVDVKHVDIYARCYLDVFKPLFCESAFPETVRRFGNESDRFGNENDRNAHTH